MPQSRTLPSSVDRYHHTRLLSFDAVCRPYHGRLYWEGQLYWSHLQQLLHSLGKAQQSHKQAAAVHAYMLWKISTIQFLLHPAGLCMQSAEPRDQISLYELHTQLLAMLCIAGYHHIDNLQLNLICRFRFKSKHKRERALLSGASVGSDAPGIAIPFIEALAGPAGVVAAATAIIANTVTGEKEGGGAVQLQ